MNTKPLLTLTLIAAFALPAFADRDPAADPAPVVEIAPAPEAEAQPEKPEFDPNATGPDKVEVQPLDPVAPAPPVAPVAPGGDFEVVPFDGVAGVVEIEPVEMKKVAFLGVATQPVDANATKELKLPEGIGLNVVHVVPDTPAAKAGVQAGDVLHKLDDQLLVHPLHLRTLIRTHKAGDAVTLTVIRAGKAVELESKLIEREVPAVDHAGPGAGAWEVAPGQLNRLVPGQRLHVGPNGIVEIGPLLELDPEGGELPQVPDDVRERIEKQHREMIKRIKQQMEQHRQLRPQPAPGRFPGPNAQMTAKTVMNDGEHKIEYAITNGKKHLTVTDKEGVKVFDGPVNTEAERKEIPEPLRKKFDKLDQRMNLNIKIMPDPFAPGNDPPAPAPGDDDEVIG